MIENYLFVNNINENENLVATYSIKSKDLVKAAKGIAVGQSIGNPEVRTERDSPEIMKNNLAKILYVRDIDTAQKKAKLAIAYPLVNFDLQEDGITQLLCILMGGQMDIDLIESCRLIDIDFPPKFLETYKGPKFGMGNIKKRAKAIDRPLLGGIVKPKTGITISQLEEIVGQMLKGGVDFIKEDEILGNPQFCRFSERVKRISYLVNNFAEKEGKEIFYAPCINSDYPYFLDRAKFASENGVKAVHLNIWAGLPAYRVIRELDLETALFFQKSGDKVITEKEHKYGIDWMVICKLLRMIGVDFAHAGMWGGYLSDTKEELKDSMNALIGGNLYKPIVPSLSCGSHPGLVDTTVRNFGKNLMMNVGGAIHGHPLGIEAGARAMRQAFECQQIGKNVFDFMKDKPELKAAIEKWGYVK